MNTPLTQVSKNDPAEAAIASANDAAPDLTPATTELVRTAIHTILAATDGSVIYGHEQTAKATKEMREKLNESVRGMGNQNVGIIFEPQKAPVPCCIGFAGARFDGDRGFRGAMHELLCLALRFHPNPTSAVILTLDWAEETFLRYWLPVLASAWMGGRQIIVLQFSLSSRNFLLHFPDRNFPKQLQASGKTPK